MCAFVNWTLFNNPWNLNVSWTPPKREAPDRTSCLRPCAETAIIPPTGVPTGAKQRCIWQAHLRTPNALTQQNVGLWSSVSTESCAILDCNDHTRRTYTINFFNVPRHECCVSATSPNNIQVHAIDRIGVNLFCRGGHPNLLAYNLQNSWLTGPLTYVCVLNIHCPSHRTNGHLVKKKLKHIKRFKFTVISS